MKKHVAPALALLCAVLAGSAHATALSLEPLSRPLDPALVRTDGTTSSTFTMRSLSVEEARDLLSSSEGAAWQVLTVQGPACASGEKVHKKNCFALRRECSKAELFARTHSKHAVCSALYIQTTVLLTNDAPPVTAAQAAKAQRLKQRKPRSPRHPAKAHRVSDKQAASSHSK